MKLAIVTRADKLVQNITSITVPIIQKYCKRVNADFIVLDHQPDIMTDDNHPHFRILKLYDLLGDYDRAISLDSDVLITKFCPNLFEEVPYDCIGTIYEDRGTRQENRRDKIKNAQILFGDISWTSGYINTGVLIVSKIHKEIFSSINGKYYTADGSDDVHIGYQIHKLGFRIHELDYRFNHTTMFSEAWNGNKNRFDSFIIHYAGAGIFDSTVKSRNEQVQKDAEFIIST